MRFRAFYALSILLAVALTSCSKPADNAATSDTQNSAAPASQDSNAPATGSSSTARKNAKSAPRQSQPAAQAPAPPPPVVVPAGTTVTVRLGEALGSKISTPGQTFRATLAQPVVVDGNTVIPSGASATGTVVDAKPLGRFKGGAVLEVRLTSISINGTEQPVETSAVTRQEKGKGKRTAVLAGGGTALGAIVGGLAGGGKGAAIGALAGAGAGGAGAAFTGNKEIVLPSESALSFSLKASVQVNPAR